jgi:hypothetical protein
MTLHGARRFVERERHVFRAELLAERIGSRAQTVAISRKAATIHFLPEKVPGGEVIDAYGNEEFHKLALAGGMRAGETEYDFVHKEPGLELGLKAEVA